MTLTRSFKATIQARVARDPVFRDALLTEGVNALLDGDLDNFMETSLAQRIYGSTEAVVDDAV